jgi:hypothetical protein
MDQGKVNAYLAPAILKAISDKIAGHRPACEAEKEPVLIRQQATVRSHFIGWSKIMIHGLDFQTRLAAAGVGTNEHHSFGIQRKTQLGRIVLHRRTFGRKLLKNRICFSRLFWDDSSALGADGSLWLTLLSRPRVDENMVIDIMSPAIVVVAVAVEMW